MNQPAKFSVVFFDIGNTIVAEKKWLPGAKELIVELTANQIRVGIISNTGDLNRDALAELLPPDFDFAFFEPSLVMLSSETGSEKPSLAAFSLAVQHAGCSPWKILFVAETIEETLAAQRAGMQAVRITAAEKDYPALKKLLLG